MLGVKGLKGLEKRDSLTLLEAISKPIECPSQFAVTATTYNSFVKEFSREERTAFNFSFRKDNLKWFVSVIEVRNVERYCAASNISQLLQWM